MTDKTKIESYEQDCGLIRVQAVHQGEAMLDRVDAALGVAERHLHRIALAVLPLTPAVAQEIEDSISRARQLLWIGAEGMTDHRTPTRSLLDEPHRAEVVTWLKAHGYVESKGGGALETAWSQRCGYDSMLLRFWPHARHEHDGSWSAIIGHHASGTNPALVIGTCETFEEVREVHDLIRRLNGYPAAASDDTVTDARTAPAPQEPEDR